jgi:hypothetical protein
VANDPVNFFDPNGKGKFGKWVKKLVKNPKGAIKDAADGLVNDVLPELDPTNNGSAIDKAGTSFFNAIKWVNPYFLGDYTVRRLNGESHEAASYNAYAYWSVSIGLDKFFPGLYRNHARYEKFFSLLLELEEKILSDDASLTASTYGWCADIGDPPDNWTWEGFYNGLKIGGDELRDFLDKTAIAIADGDFDYLMNLINSLSLGNLLGGGVEYDFYIPNNSEEAGVLAFGVLASMVDGMKMPTSKALSLAQDFLGKNYRQIGNWRFVSSDGKRVVRLGDNCIDGKHGGGPHINFEILEPNPAKPGKMRVKSNFHIYLED